ncbi:unnamed protein product [Triticum turgidum subsp. durum]|uniref:RING-type E3 ubiquitin transferase n=1 Tax=Triticum turgidum subsp. durum TaxID=4567 RepID=A0A9R0ZZV1_TRITD|nr:unnamed protein product [Triticum turgidum subsp. durum]
MGAARAWRWKLLPFHSRPPPPPPTPSLPATLSPVDKEEDVPREFLCPILGAPMSDPVILPSGRTYERACIQACAELSVSPPGVEGDSPASGGVVPIPNDALGAAIRTWSARSGRAPPEAPSAAAAREAVLRAVPTPRPPGRSSSNLSCSSRASAASTSSSSSRSSSEITAVEQLDMACAKETKSLRVGEGEEEVGQLSVKAVGGGDEWEVESAMAALRRATRESAPRRRALCVPQLLAALRRVLLSARHSAAARADATAALANLSLEPENRVPIVRAGAVPALVEVASLGAAAPEACEHAAGALFGLALHEGNRAAIGVLGALPPLLALLTAGDQAPRARRDAGMALLHLSLAAVNQSKLARAPGAAKNLLSISSDSNEPLPIRRLALMVICNVAACAEGRTALMDAGAVATFSVILSNDAHRSELQECCVAALYDMSKGSPRFRGLARAAGADRPLILIAEQADPGVHKDMARKALRAMLGLGDINGGGLHDFSNSERNDDDSGTMASSLPVRRRRAASWGAPPASKLSSSHHWRSVCID